MDWVGFIEKFYEMTLLEGGTGRRECGLTKEGPRGKRLQTRPYGVESMRESSPHEKTTKTTEKTKKKKKKTKKKKNKQNTKKTHHQTTTNNHTTKKTTKRHR